MSATSVESFDAMTDAQVLQRLREIERGRRAFEVEEAALLAQVRSRSLAFGHGCKTEVDFLRQLLTIGAVDAARRLKLAAAVTPRRSPTGELLPAGHEQVAAAFTAGAISGAAAVTIAQTVDKLPADTLDLEHGAGRAVEAVLVEFARDHDPDTLRTGVHRQPPHLRSHGWHSEMLHGQPVWVRPTWIDEDQVPRRNKLHDY